MNLYLVTGTVMGAPVWALCHAGNHIEAADLLAERNVNAIKTYAMHDDGDSIKTGTLAIMADLPPTDFLGLLRPNQIKRLYKVAVTVMVDAADMGAAQLRVLDLLQEAQNMDPSYADFAVAWTKAENYPAPYQKGAALK